MSNVVTPHTYAEWVIVLSALKSKSDDERVIAAMYNGTLSWQSGVAERFSDKLFDAVNYRLNEATDKFQLEIGRAGGQEHILVAAILALRKELKFLLKCMNLPVIPEKDRSAYCNLVYEQADRIQKSLEDSAKRDRSGKLASIIRNNKVTAFSL